MSKRIVLLQALTASIANLSLLVEGIDQKVFGHRADSEDWSVADVVNHLIAVEAQYLRRLQRVLVEERPFLPAIHPDRTTHNLEASAAELLAQFKDARQATLAFLRDMVDDGWGNTAVHETQGDVTFHFLVQYLVEHDGEHLNQIIEIRQQLKAAPGRKAQPAISK